MSTEDIKIKDGRIVVERAGSKQNVDVAVSDVDSVAFHRGGEANGASDGHLVIRTKQNEDIAIRVADNEAGKALKLVYDALDSSKETKKETPKDKTTTADSDVK